MSYIYSFDGFEAENFEKDNGERPEVWKYAKSGLVDKELSGEFMDGIVLPSGNSVGIIDYLMEMIQEETEDIEDLKRDDEILNLLGKLSEKDGRLVEKYSGEEPMSFGYLTNTEVKRLLELLKDVSLDEDQVTIVTAVLEKADLAGLGVLYYAS